ncbi:efflux RND transporter permease subunit [Desulforamulus aeronauticus]|uniref:Hydrophobic/amphiphilic exporter-1, HAE1 family n=1 Tax=Desulforamulus aeronauticus DSM 10349 TaxID=1121421 RepID=A0A1M6WIS4_9FIRM|nr:efflux RND transporter permease subunit [Desulforamulus aeronauticus]SHK93672.1 hydrophobic/amphiphilic exporter-1, HAE1 family [Desulforamulus aeronauticus DSM 10349]
MFLTNLSLKRPVFATVTILALVAVGIISYLGLNINDYPEVEFPYVSVTVVQPGASPEQIESKIIYKLEEAIGQIAGVKHIYASAREGYALVFAEFSLETPAEVAAQDVRDKIGTIRGQLPQDIEEPVIGRFDPSAMPIISLAVTGELSMREMTTIVEDAVKKRLETVNGVGSIDIYGDVKREIQINLDKDKLAAYGISSAEVLNSLRNENMEVPGGKVGSGDREMTLRTVGKINRVEEFLNLPVARREGVQLYVKDIATVLDGVKEQDSISRYQGNPAIGIDIIKQSGSNTVKVANNIKKVVEEVKQELPPGVKLEIVRDNSLYIKDAVNDVRNTLIEGSVLAVLTVFVFLRDWRSTLISALAIPTSIIATFFAMKMLGFTLNFMSLMALSLAVGLLIDDAIVVVENIVRHLRMGKSPLDAARDGTSELGLAVTATSLTVVAVFLPVGMMSGIVGQFFKQFGITVVFSVLVSLFVAFTLVPMLSSRYLKDEEHVPRGPFGKFINGFNRGFDRITQRYANFLTIVLRNRRKTIGAAVLLFFGSLLLIPFLGSAFVPGGDMAEVTVVAELDAGLSTGAASQITRQLEEILQTYPEVTKVYSTTKNEKASIFVKVVDKHDRDRTLDELAMDMRGRLVAVPGVRITVNQQAGMNDGAAVQFRLLGDDLEQMQGYAELAQRIMETIPGAVDVSTSYQPGNPEGQIRIKQDVAADLGVSTAMVADTLRTLFNGVVVNQFEDGEDRFDVRVRLQETNRQDLAALQTIYLTSLYDDNGRYPMIPLSQVTETVFSTSPSQIDRFDRTKEIQLFCNLNGLSVGEFNKIFLERVNKEIKLPVGYSFYAGGDSEMMGETFTAMILALVTAVLFIFFILAAQFESYIDPFSIMLSLPMAIVGAILGLLLVGSDLSIMSMIGIIMLMGLVTKNAILLIDFTKQQRAKGVERNEALRRAALTRLRPIIMTSTAMILGMLPLALALGPGAESRAPMAHAIIGGLITSTLLTLVVVPVIYTILDDLKSKSSHVKQRVFSRWSKSEKASNSSIQS